MRSLIAAAALVALCAGCGSVHSAPSPATTTAPPPVSTSAPPPPPRTDPPPPPVASLFDQVNGDGAYRHLAALQGIADRNGGTRVSPGPGYDASFDYVATALTDAGYQVSTPTFKQNGQQVRQVIAQTRTGDPSRTIMFGAHLDSVKKGPGIDDNGSGVAGLLELAIKLGPAPQTHNAVRFAFWGGEEEGDLGSEAYVKDLPQGERDNVLFYLNADMIGSANGGYFVQGNGPGKSPEIAQVVTEQLARTGIDADDYVFEGESDYDAFVKHDIPTVGVLTSGDRDELTKEQAAKWGGRVDDIAPYYHSAGDTLAHIDRTVFDHWVRTLAGTLERFLSYDGQLR